MTRRLKCPKCKTADHIGTNELISGFAEASIEIVPIPLGIRLDINHYGETEVDWDTSESTTIGCSNCGWNDEGEYLKAATDAAEKSMRAIELDYGPWKAAEALDEIHAILDGEEWDSSTIEDVAAVIERSGRKISAPGEEPVPCNHDPEALTEMVPWRSDDFRPAVLRCECGEESDEHGRFPFPSHPGGWFDFTGCPACDAVGSLWDFEPVEEMRAIDGTVEADGENRITGVALSETTEPTGISYICCRECMAEWAWPEGLASGVDWS